MVTEAHLRRAVLAALFFAGVVRAEGPVAPATPAPPPPPGEATAPVAVAPVLPLPVLHHAPVTVVRAHAALVVTADIEDPEQLERALVVYRTGEKADLHTVELLRTAGPAGYAAEIPARDVVAPFIEYAIEVVPRGGAAVAVFAKRATMHRVAVREEYLDLREQALLARLHGQRTVISLGGEFVSFGRSLATVDTSTRRISDHYYRVEGAFTYRPLRTVTEFTAKLGVLRGRSPAPWADSSNDLDVGMNYTAASLRLRGTDGFHVDVEGLTSLTEQGFELGLGSQAILGDPYGSRLALGFQSVHNFGERFWSRVDITAGQRLVVSPIVEATNWPHADQYGIRLLVDLAVDLGKGFGAVAGGGYQAREATSGGASGALRLMRSF